MTSEARHLLAAGLVAVALLLQGCTPEVTAGPDASAAPAVSATSAAAPAPLGLPAPSGTVPAGWGQHTTAGDRVGFALPPGAQQDSTPNPEAPDVLIDSFVAADGETVLTVLWQPWPAGQGPPRDGTVEQALQDFRDGFTSGSDLDPGTVAQQRLEVQGRPGLELTGVAGTRGTAVSARYLLLEQGGLGLVVLAPDEAGAATSADILFETLRLP